jgi:hypothetical protein
VVAGPSLAWLGREECSDPFLQVSETMKQFRFGVSHLDKLVLDGA